MNEIARAGCQKGWAYTTLQLPSPHPDKPRIYGGSGGENAERVDMKVCNEKTSVGGRGKKIQVGLTPGHGHTKGQERARKRGKRESTQKKVSE